MELFIDEHLTDQAIKSLADGTLDDLQTLELCEHMAECSACAEKISDAVCVGSLNRGFDELVVLKIAEIERAKRQGFARYCAGIAVGVAAAIALTFSGTTLPQTMTYKPKPDALPAPTKMHLPEPQQFVIPEREEQDKEIFAQIGQYFTSITNNIFALEK
ncbi:MAG: hypothetical protein RR998_06420 [Oscillospiraceae bacterium]